MQTNPDIQHPRASRAGALKRYLSGADGNILPLAALIIPAVILALGSAYDYTAAGQRQETLNGISDAAALSATQPAIMGESCYPNSTSPNNPAECNLVVAQVVNVFNAQAAAVTGVTSYTINSSNVSIVDSSATNQATRTATVNWSANSNNMFAGTVGFANIAIGGTSEAKNGASPVTTIYMLIDNSPSMAFPAQSTGVSTMIDSTPGNNIAAGNGCALGCHEYNTGAYSSNWNPANVICANGANAISNGVFTDGGAAFPCIMNVAGTTEFNPRGAGYTTYTVGSNTYTCSSGSGSANQNVGTCAAGTSEATAYGTGGCMAGIAGSSSAAPGSQNKYYGGEDSFALSRCLDVQLRIDLVNSAVASLFSTAPTIAQDNKTTYAIQLYTLDYGNNNVPDTYSVNPISSDSTKPTKVVVGLYDVYNWGCSTASPATPACTTAYTPAQIQAQSWSTMNGWFADATTVAGTLAPLETYTAGSVTGNGVTLSSGVSGYSSQNTGSDDDSYIDEDGLAGMYSLMPTPGTGLSGSTPAGLLFIVSDGENDTNGSKPTNSCVGSSGVYTYFGRPQFCVNQLTSGGKDYCTLVKNEGIRIAFLYLRFNGLNPYPEYFSDIEPWQYPGDDTNHTNNFTGQTDEIEQAAISCATSGLEFTVDTDTDIASAMSALFQKAVQTAYLAK